ncbi:MAG: carbon monoxide dehydrogenase subunit G [Candidatus Caldarchaeum sp.]|nr:carbon monoxide dehydrogenase subunit G [Candidatus Caldarchaeum sp.]MCS7133279.1 carbon monoxide dehydrogenase subunit G [Candidatus Caldarchaeum sp.]MCX8201899.1 carbon monoxide dehydrogenase subunit G [Candidatus Caldarchaeum sp.]MDW8062669.1 carbon monoxide dehydrogenase subunit G [Candidatus Caldarchaeum sp.]MDW8435443.1 carbon monoxide dehydrogenase subunit G [Candidatus Caldarchaeum sp.]
MKLADKFTVAADRETVFKFITNPDSFTKLIPDVQKYEKIDERNFKVVFKIGLGMIKGTLNMAFKMEEVNAPEYVKVVGHGSGMQSTADLVLNLKLLPADGGTEVAWDADVVVGGMVASVGSRLMESTTKSKVREIVEGLKRELEGGKKKKK